jgi:pimeloyl-ACP methyl ester carboxylesterase
VPFAPQDDVSLYYETFGDPADPTLLLINGLSSQCINYRVEWCEKFVAAGFHLIRFDNRDVGLSTKLEAEGASYQVADMVGDALAVLDAAGVDQAHVMGFSMGGMIVQQMAIDHAERMLTMTSVMSTTGDRDVGNPTAEALAILMGPPATDREGAVARYLAGIRAYGSPAHYDEARLVPLAEEAYDRCFYPDGVARQMQAIIKAGSRTSALGSVRMPALVLHGDQDRLVDISGGRRTAEAIPGARFVVLEGMGHDYPPQYWDRIVSLVASHAGVGAPAA